MSTALSHGKKVLLRQQRSICAASELSLAEPDPSPLSQDDTNRGWTLAYKLREWMEKRGRE